jgi:hypothetical protein
MLRVSRVLDTPTSIPEKPEFLEGKLFWEVRRVQTAGDPSSLRQMEKKSGRDPEPKEFILYLDHPSIPPSIHPYIYGAPQNGKDSNGLKVPPITCEEQRHIDEAPKRVSQAAQASLQISGVYRIYRS